MMNTLRYIGKPWYGRSTLHRYGLMRLAYGCAAYVLLLAAILLALAPSTSAAQVTTRSIRMSDSSQGVAGTSYLVSFTTGTTSALQGIVVDFCDESPILGATCTTPSGFSVGTPVVTGLTGTNPTTGWTAGQLNTNRTLTLTNASGASVNSGTTISFTVTTITNPGTNNHAFYARVLTYATAAGATAYTAATPGTHIDDGGIALSTARAITITARVMESLSFCVYKTTCSDDPSFTIGHGPLAILDQSTVDTADVKFSISTNAQGTTTVRLKGDTLTSGANSIAAAGAATPFVAGTEKFGLRVSVPGSLTAAAPYNGGANTYGMNVANTTSTYGETVGSLTGPIASSVTTVTYGATTSNTTPAAIYTTVHQYIATASF